LENNEKRKEISREKFFKKLRKLPGCREITIKPRDCDDLKTFLEKKRQWEEESKNGPEMKFKGTAGHGKVLSINERILRAKPVRLVPFKKEKK